MDVLLVIFAGTCAIILCGGLVSYVMEHQKISKKAALKEHQIDDLQYRLDEMDRRLSDIQEVMISLNEKFEHWDERTHPREG